MNRLAVLVAAAMLTLLSAIPTEAKHGPNYCYSCARDSKGRIKRSASARKSFLRSKGLSHTPKGCQVDHVVPLAKGGRDDPSNMQLLCGEQLKAKERSELR